MFRNSGDKEDRPKRETLIGFVFCCCCSEMNSYIELCELCVVFHLKDIVGSLSVLLLVCFTHFNLLNLHLPRRQLLLLSHFSRVGLCAAPSPGFSRQEHWSGCHRLLQCMNVARESEVAQSSPTLRYPMDRSPPGSSVHGILQARALEWVPSPSP